MSLVDVIIILVLHLSRPQQVREKDRCPIISVYEYRPPPVKRVGHCSSAELIAPRDVSSMYTMHTLTHYKTKQWQPGASSVALVPWALARGPPSLLNSSQTS
jgi:hypothetical protein